MKRKFDQESQQPKVCKLARPGPPPIVPHRAQRVPQTVLELLTEKLRTLDLADIVLDYSSESKDAFDCVISALALLQAGRYDYHSSCCGYDCVKHGDFAKPSEIKWLEAELM